MHGASDAWQGLLSVHWPQDGAWLLAASKATCIEDWLLSTAQKCHAKGQLQSFPTVGKEHLLKHLPCHRHNVAMLQS